MRSYFERMDYDFRDKKIALPLNLEKLINSEFLTSNDYVFLKGNYGNKENPLYSEDLDKSEWEENETHFHPDQYSPSQTEELEFLILALESSKRLAKRLRNTFPNRKFPN